MAKFGSMKKDSKKEGESMKKERKEVEHAGGRKVGQPPVKLAGKKRGK